jgi:hypothetical protein
MFKRALPLLVIIVIQLLIYGAPHLYGVYHQNKDFVFTGQFGPSNENNDTQCANCFYLTMGFKQSYDGALIIEDKFQGYDTYPKILHPWWIIGGHLARALGIDILTFNVLQRLLWTVLAAAMVYYLSLKLFRKTILAAFALLFFNFSSYLIRYTPEGTVFVANIAAVVLPLTYLLLAVLFYFLYQLIHQKKVLMPLSAVTLFLAFSYPYAIITFAASVFLFFFYLWRSHQNPIATLVKWYAIIFTPASIVVAYDFFLVVTDPRLIGSQSHVHSDSFPLLLLGYLPFTFFAFLFVIKLFSERVKQTYKNFWVYLMIFSLCCFVFTQIPTSLLAFSMQMIVGVQLPLILMTIEYMRRYMTPKWMPLFLIISLLITIVPGGMFYKDIFSNMKNHHIPSYIPSNIHEGILWLDQNASKQSQLLCMPYWSSYAGIWSGTRLYIGGDILFTPDYENRLAQLYKVLEDPDMNALNQFLRKERIDFVFYDQKLQSADIHGHLRAALPDVVFTNTAVTILKCNFKENP